MDDTEAADRARWRIIWAQALQLSTVKGKPMLAAWELFTGGGVALRKDGVPTPFMLDSVIQIDKDSEIL